MSNKVDEGADEGRSSDAVKNVIMEFTVVLSLAEFGGEILDDGSRPSSADKGDTVKKCASTMVLAVMMAGAQMVLSWLGKPSEL